MILKINFESLPTLITFNPSVAISKAVIDLAQASKAMEQTIQIEDTISKMKANLETMGTYKEASRLIIDALLKAHETELNVFLREINKDLLEHSSLATLPLVSLEALVEQMGVETSLRNERTQRAFILEALTNRLISTFKDSFKLDFHA